MSSLSATVYVHHLLDKNLTFPQFALVCARAMGALVMMRDESMDAPIPERFEPSDHYVKREVEARATLARLTAMSNDERIAYAEAERAKRIAELQESKVERDHDVGFVSLFGAFIAECAYELHFVSDLGRTPESLALGAVYFLAAIAIGQRTEANR